MTECLICGRELTDPVSVERQVGPVCWARLQHQAAIDQEWETPTEPRVLMFNRLKETKDGDT